MKPLLPFSLLVAAGMLTAASAFAQTTVFYDNFDGAAGGLNGTAPTIGTGTWSAASIIQQDGSGLLKSVTGDPGTSTNYLAYTLSAGNIYELSVDMFGNTPTSNTSQFAGIGFFNTSIASKAFTANSPTTPWMFLRTQNADASEGDMDLRSTGSNTNAINSSFDVTVSRNYKLVLNTNDTDAGTAGNQFSISLFVDDAQYGSTIVYSDAQSTSLLANVVSVGITGTTNLTQVNFDNFKLTVIPEPSTYALLAGIAILATAVVRRKR